MTGGSIPAMHTVAVLALDGVIAFDLSTPIEVFGRVRLPGDRPGYRVLVVGPRPQVNAGPLKIGVPHRLDALLTADTIVVPGLANPAARVDESVLAALRAAATGGARIASICVGAFTLAATGLLDGSRATTHWRAAAALAKRHPRVRVDPDVLYVDNGSTLTSAGAAAGIDLCLHLVQRDYGAAVARDAARSAVVPLARTGGQAQFIPGPDPGSDQVSLAAVLDWIEERADRPLTVENVATRARCSIRTLHRRFQEQTGRTPLLWINQVRVTRAQVLLETTSQPVERIASAAGFGSAANLRARFRDATGTTPGRYRRAFTASVRA